MAQIIDNTTILSPHSVSERPVGHFESCGGCAQDKVNADLLEGNVRQLALFCSHQIFRKSCHFLFIRKVEQSEGKNKNRIDGSCGGVFSLVQGG